MKLKTAGKLAKKTIFKNGKYINVNINNPKNILWLNNIYSKTTVNTLCNNNILLTPPKDKNCINHYKPLTKANSSAATIYPKILNTNFRSIRNNKLDDVYLMLSIHKIEVAIITET